MLDALRFGGERPRLVHRLDKDTSGVLVLARTARAATALTAAFRAGEVRKLYWAVVVGVPASAGGADRAAAEQALRRHRRADDGRTRPAGRRSPTTA